MKIEFHCRRIFESFYRSEKRWSIIVAHRRAGKTVACVHRLIIRALMEGKERGRYGYIAPFYSQAKQVAWEYLKLYSRQFQLEEPRESELSVRLLGGSVVRLYGADNPNPLRGLYFDGVVMDEYADMKPTVWPEVIRPTLADRLGWAVFIGTPKGRNAFWELWTKASRDWFSLMLKASETGILPESELALSRLSMTADQYAQEYECNFEAAIHGAIYGKWMREALDQGRIRTVDWDPSIPVNTAWDLGFDDATAIWWWQELPGEIHLIDYYESNGQDIGHYCEVLKSKPYQYGEHYVPHDAGHKTLAAGGRSTGDLAYAQGVKMTVLPAPSQQNSIEAARKTIERCWFDKDRCNLGIEALRQYQFELDEERKMFKSKPRHDWASHGSDAFEIIAQVWQLPQRIKDSAKPRFLNEATADELFWPTEANRGFRERL